MKKLIFLLGTLSLLILPNKAAIIPNPLISRGKPVFTSKGSAAYLVDDLFNTSSWTVSNNTWIAIEVGSGASQVFFTWNNPTYAWSNELSPAQCPNSNSFPVDYNLLVSSNSTDGVDGDWTIADSIRSNIVVARGHLIDFTGAKWVKMQIITGGGQIDEIEVFDASNGDEDVWFFAGTSISANAFKGTPPGKTFADLLTQKHAEYNPAMIRGGIGCINSNDFVNNLPKYLKMAGNAHYWAIEMGTNDAWGGTNANVTTFKSNLQIVIDSCKAHGIQPILARVLATNPAYTTNPTGWQIHPDYLKAVDDLTKSNNLIPGPDFYTWFLTHPDDLNTDGVHPSAFGAASIHMLWAQKMDSLYGGCSLAEVVPNLQVNQNEMVLLATATVYTGDTVILSPEATSEGSWYWSGPAGYTANSREITLDSIKTTQAGTYIVTYSYGDTCSTSYSYRLTVKRRPVTGISNNKSAIVGVFPNPSALGKFSVQLSHVFEGAQVQIYDLQGKLTYHAFLEQNITEISTSLLQGVYLIRIINGPETTNQQLIID
jgi:lysophospholipase L1-like esterase